MKFSVFISMKGNSQNVGLISQISSFLLGRISDIKDGNVNGLAIVLVFKEIFCPNRVVLVIKFK